ncbi:DNA-binding protein [Streptomyces sp. NPDC005708]|uniref:DNA-binding protein n=1 Tax=Streptomyces sp. NPDC005708 TaxID=3154564 RepID=UPI0033FE0674
MTARKVATAEAPTLAEIRTWPATVSVPKAATALGCSRAQLYVLIRTGRSPVRTLSLGESRVVVVTASLARVLNGETEPAAYRERLSA